MDNESSPPPLPEIAPAKTSGMAITSLVLGILGLFSCGFTALIGLILGIVSLVKIQNSGGKLKGFGLALAGTIVSGIFLLMIPIFAAMLLPALAQAKQKAMEINSMNNEKQLALAVMMYSNDHTNHLPSAATWCDDIRNEVGNSQKVFKSGAANSSSRCDYAFNAKLDGMDMDTISHPAETVLIFESDAGWNANGGAELLPSRSRYGSGTRRVFIVAFADGHVEAVTPARINSLHWDPNQ